MTKVFIPSGKISAKKREFKAIAADIRHAVFSVVRQRLVGELFQSSCVGSGFFVSSTVFVTCWHVIDSPLSPHVPGDKYQLVNNLNGTNGIVLDIVGGMYPLVQQPEFPSPGSFDTVDFFGSSLAFTNFAPNFQYDFEIDFSPGTCQDIPPLAGTGAVPTFTSKTCNQIQGGGEQGGPPEEQINYITSVDFVVEGGATTPEPSSFILLGTGLAGLFQIGFRRMRAARKAS
jgi:PEP-CTERM motif